MNRGGPVLVRLGASLGLVFLASCARKEPPGKSGAPVLETIRLQTDWYPQAEHGGFYQAQVNGFYASAGVNVVIVPGGPGITPLQALMSGYVDISVSRSDDIIVDVSHGLPLVIIGVYMEHDPQAILVHEEDTIRNFRDLNGRTMMAAPESNWITYLRLHYHIDFNLIPLNFGMGEFMADKRFVQQCFVTSEPFYVQKNGGHARTLLIADSGYNPYRCLVTTRRFLTQHPGAVRAFVASSIRGWKDFLYGDPARALAMISSLNPQVTYDLLNFSIRVMREQGLVAGRPELGEQVGLMTRGRLEAQARTLAQIGITESVLPLERFATFDCLPDDLRAAALR